MVIHMLAVDIGHHRDGRRQKEKTAVAFIRLRDDKLALAHLGVGAEAAHPAADHHGRIETGGAEHMGDHRRRGGLAVAPGHRYPIFRAHQLGEHFSARNHRDLAAARLEHFRIGIFHRRGDHHHRGIHRQVVLLVSDEHPRAQGAQPRRRFAIVEIGARNRITLVQQNFRYAAHADAADADEMYFMFFVQHDLRANG